MSTICATPRCPFPAIHRGRCTLHAESTSERGYGSRWQGTSRAVRQGSVCERCGTTLDLTTDHRTPRSLGGGDNRSNLRVLCRSCHGTVGVKRNHTGDRGRPSNKLEKDRSSLTRAAFREGYSDTEPAKTPDRASLVVIG